MLLSGRVLYWGTPLLQFVPWHRYAIDVLREGHLPLWNALVGAGAPLLANYQSALFYPPNLLLFVTGPEFGHGLLVFLHLVWAGLGMRALARHLRIKPAGQMIAAMAFSLSGYMVARAGFISINHTAAWLPWVVLALDRLLGKIGTDPRIGAWIRPLAVFSLILGMQWLAGHAQTAWYTLILILAWTIWRLLEWHDRGRQMKAIGLLAGASLLAFALTAVQLIPTLEYLQQTPRATALDMEYALTYSFWPWRTLGLLLPDLFGSPAYGDFWGYGNFWEDAIYIGVLPLLLAFGIALKKVRARDGEGRLVRFLLLLAGISLLLALGKNTPVYPYLFTHIPTFSLFQAPARWNLLLVFGLALLAGLGYERWTTPTGRGLYWTRLGTVGAAVIGLAAFLGSLGLNGVEPTFVRAFAIAGIWLAAAGALTLFLPKTLTPGRQLLVGGALLLDLVIAGWGLNPSLPASVYQGGTALKQLASNEGNLRLYMPTEVEYTVTFERSHRFDTFDAGIDWRLVREAGIPNTPLLELIPSLNNFDPFIPDRFALLTAAIEASPEGQRDRLLALLDVGWVAVDSGTGPLGVQYQQVQDGRRLWLMPGAVAVDSIGEALSIIEAGQFDPSRMAILEAPDAVERLVGGPASAGPIVEDGPNRIKFNLKAPQGTWIVLADSWYPGWQIDVDGERGSLYPAFVALRGAWVPAGTHEIQMSYHPTSFYSGAALSMLGWILWAVLFFRWKEE